MKMRSAVALAFLTLAATGAKADEQPTAAGFWQVTEDGKPDGKPTAWFMFTQKNDVFSARLVKGFKTPDEMKEVKKADLVCGKCTGPKKGARIMGLTLFWGMKRDGLKYTEGSVLDPRDGSVYHALMNLSDDGQTLEVRGYLGIPMLGKSQTWYRLPDNAMKDKDVPKEVLAKNTSAPAPSTASASNEAPSDAH